MTGRYRIVVARGQYLLCVRPNCIGLRVEAGKTVTVNVKRRYGSTGFFVGASSDTSFKEDFGFEVGY